MVAIHRDIIGTFGPDLRSRREMLDENEMIEAPKVIAREIHFT